MGVIELRDKIIELLNTDNISYLEDVFKFAEKKKSASSDSFLELPNEIQEILLESSDQADRGELTPHAQVMEEVRERYNISK
jgi:hypothetical protein